MILYYESKTLSLTNRNESKNKDQFTYQHTSITCVLLDIDTITVKSSRPSVRIMKVVINFN